MVGAAFVLAPSGDAMRTLCAAAIWLTVSLLGSSCTPVGGETALPDEISGLWCRAEKPGLSLVRVATTSTDPAFVGLSPVVEVRYRSHGKATSGLLDGGAARWFAFSDGARGEERWLVYDRVDETLALGSAPTVEAKVVLLTDEKLTLDTHGDYQRIAAEPAVDSKICAGPAATGGGGEVVVAKAKLVLDAVMSLDADTAATPGSVHRIGSQTLAAAWTAGNGKVQIAAFSGQKAPKWTASLPGSGGNEAPVRVQLLDDGRVFASWPYRANIELDGHKLDGWNGSGNLLSRGIAVASLDAKTGKAAWLQHVGGPGGDDDAVGLHVAPSGLISLAATVRSSPTYIAPAQGNAKDNPAKALLAQLDASGKAKLALPFSNQSASYHQRVLATAADAASNLRVLGASAAQSPAEKVICWGTCVRSHRADLTTRWVRILAAQPAASGAIGVGAGGETVAALAGKGGMTVAALAEADGAVVWRADNAAVETVSGVAKLGTGATVVAGFRVEAGVHGWLRGYDKDGAALWTAELGAVEGTEVTRLVAGSGGSFAVLGRSVSGVWGGVAVGKGVFFADLHTEVLQ